MLENNTRIQQFIHQRVDIILISNSKAKYPFIWIDWIVGWDQKNYIKIIKYSKKEKNIHKIVAKWVFWFHWMISKQRFFQYSNKSKKKTSCNIRSLWRNILRIKLYRIIWLIESIFKCEIRFTFELLWAIRNRLLHPHDDHMKKDEEWSLRK